MELGFGLASSKDSNWWVFTLPAFLGSGNLLDGVVLLAIAAAFLSVSLLTWAFSGAGVAWKNGRERQGSVPIPGVKGLPVLGSLVSLSRGLAHRTLASMAASQAATQLMAFSLGSTPVVVASDPTVAKEILTSPHFADRPVKQSAKTLMFSRAIGFATNGEYWRLLRRIASSHLFSPRRISAHEPGRQLDCTAMLSSIARSQAATGLVYLRPHLQAAALNNIMGSVFGKRYDVGSYSREAEELKEMVREGFDLLGAFNWSDYLPWLQWFYDPHRINRRCAALVPRVRAFVKRIIDVDHRDGNRSAGNGDGSDFVDVLLSLQGDERLADNDMIAVLWVSSLICIFFFNH